ncbi:MAG: hypothetical protein CFK52_00345 [Chloracidobacterium sp. CP2_5A]|nr:MAG: hypothetical protein CFK52_00345 [Chloracidobacterium sp. CP2_5A]
MRLSFVADQRVDAADSCPLGKTAYRPPGESNPNRLYRAFHSLRRQEKRTPETILPGFELARLEALSNDELRHLIQKGLIQKGFVSARNLERLAFKGARLRRGLCCRRLAGFFSVEKRPEPSERPASGVSSAFPRESRLARPALLRRGAGYFAAERCW